MRAAKFKIVVLLSILLSGLLSNPAKAITFGGEVISASTQYSYVISIWHSESPEIPPRFICTGTLIDSTVVLTAAHCLQDENGIPVKGAFFVKYGNNLLQDGSLREVSATWYSPQYSARQNTA